MTVGHCFACNLTPQITALISHIDTLDMNTINYLDIAMNLDMNTVK